MTTRTELHTHLRDQEVDVLVASNPLVAYETLSPAKRAETLDRIAAERDRMNELGDALFSLGATLTKHQAALDEQAALAAAAAEAAQAAADQQAGLEAEAAAAEENDQP